jgi:hypothetical protein
MTDNQAILLQMESSFPETFLLLIGVILLIKYLYNKFKPRNHEF